MAANMFPTYFYIMVTRYTEVLLVVWIFVVSLDLCARESTTMSPCDSEISSECEVEK